MGYERLGKGPGMARAQHKGARHTGGYPLSTPSTGSTLSTMVSPAPAADANPALAPKLKLLGTPPSLAALPNLRLVAGDW